MSDQIDVDGVIREMCKGLTGRYDREGVRNYLRESFRKILKDEEAKAGETFGDSYINGFAIEVAAEIEKHLWERFDSALVMGLRALTTVAAAISLASIYRRRGEPEEIDHMVRSEMRTLSKIREELVDTALDPWLKQFAASFNRPGRPPKDDDQIDRDMEEKDKQLAALLRVIEEIVDVWSKKKNDEQKITFEILHREIAKRGHAMSVSSLKRKLAILEENMTSIRMQIEEKQLK